MPGPRAVRADGARASSRARSASGDGAVRYRAELEARGAVVPPDDDPATSRAPRTTLARDRLRPGRRGRAALRPRPRRRAGARVSFELRRLELADLDAIEPIEQVSYPTPWSRSMFVGELTKPSSRSLGAVDERRSPDRLPHPLALRRRLARDERRRRARAPSARASPRRCWSGSSRRPPRTRVAGTRSRCASRTRPRSRSTSASASARAACAAATTRTTARTR